MGTYYYGVCHDCKVWGMLPKCPEDAAAGWVRDLMPDHTTHNLVILNEYEVYPDWGYYEAPPSPVKGYTRLDLMR